MGSSMRQLATEIGIGTTTIWQFVRGATPQPPTHAKLAHWYRSQRPAVSAEGDATYETDAARASAALEFLTRHIAPEHRLAIARDILRRLSSAPAAAPDWLGGVKLPGV